MTRLRFAVLAPLALLFVLAVPDTARAGHTPFSQAGRFGLGLSGGYGPGGLTGKLYVAPELAVQVTLGGWYKRGLAANVSAIFEMLTLTRQKYFWINWNLGVGANLAGFDRYAGVGVSGVLGLGFQLTRAPLEFVAEWRPTFFPGYGVYVPHSGGSIRFFF